MKLGCVKLEWRAMIAPHPLTFWAHLYIRANRPAVFISLYSDYFHEIGWDLNNNLFSMSPLCKNGNELIWTNQSNDKLKLCKT